MTYTFDEIIAFIETLEFEYLDPLMDVLAEDLSSYEDWQQKQIVALLELRVMAYQFLWV